MVTISGSESVVTLLVSILQEQILVSASLESESPSISDVQTSSQCDLSFKSLQELCFIQELVHGIKVSTNLTDLIEQLLLKSQNSHLKIINFLSILVGFLVLLFNLSCK